MLASVFCLEIQAESACISSLTPTTTAAVSPFDTTLICAVSHHQFCWLSLPSSPYLSSDMNCFSWGGSRPLFTLYIKLTHSCQRSKDYNSFYNIKFIAFRQVPVCVRSSSVLPACDLSDTVYVQKNQVHVWSHLLQFSAFAIFTDGRIGQSHKKLRILSLVKKFKTSHLCTSRMGYIVAPGNPLRVASFLK